jgi:hypothetical protein
MYITAAVLCAAGVLCAVVSDVWAGNPPFAPGSGQAANEDTAQTPAPAAAGLDERLGATAVPDGVISAGTNIFWITRYTKCGHEKVRELPPEASMIGKTYAQFAQCYPKYRLETPNGTLCMVIEYDQYCPEHYIIKADDNGYIYVYRNMDGEDKLSAVMRMDFTTEAVPQDYRPLLKEGMAFGSVEEIEGLIEDAQT